MSLFKHSLLQDQYERNPDFHELVDFLESRITKNLSIQKLHKLSTEAILLILERVSEKEEVDAYRKEQQPIKEARRQMQADCQHEWGYMGTHLYGYCMKCMKHW